MKRRRMMLPPFHGQRIGGRRGDDGRGDARGRALLAGGRAVRALAADAGDHPGGDHALGLRRRRSAAPGRAADAAAAADRGAQRAGAAAHGGRPGAALAGPRGRLPRGDGAGRSGAAGGGRPAPAGRRGRPPGHRLDPDRGAPRGRLAARRARAARRTDDAADRRADLVLAGLGVRAAAAPPAEAAPPAGGGLGGRPTTPTWTPWSRRRCGSARRCRWSCAGCSSRWSWAATRCRPGRWSRPAST